MDSDSSDDDTDPLNMNTYLHPNNPYVKPYIHNSIIIYDGIPVISNNDTIIIPKQYLYLAIKIEEQSCYIRLCIIFDLMINIASGKKTCSEVYDYVDNEFNPWNIGPIV